ncbi:glycosyltransferase family 4 protein [Ramlibacter algicola]|uniref:glycosyltransferase family 4 protein n=1 Tax=Ramlibacter algicola TaxID=2795217 RepID=UPI003B8477C1
MKVAIVHEWFDTYAGSERVVEQMLQLFPQADVFGVVDVLPDRQRAFLGGRPVHTTFIQHLPFARRRFRHYLALMPLAVEQLDLSGYDLVLSSSHAVAKGVLTGPNQLHVSYVHSPMRYATDLQHQYLREAGLAHGPAGLLARVMLHYLRMWDFRTGPGVDVFIANSAFVAHRVRKTYGRESTVVYPPVDVDAFALRADKDDYYFAAARMVPYKKMPLLVEAFTHMPARRLVVAGEGPDLQRCRKLAAGHPNIELVGHLPFDRLREHMQRARAFVFAAEEDFGITLVEAQACGTPVIAFGRGGARETVRTLGGSGTPTGVLFDAQTPASVVAAVGRFEAAGHQIQALHCRANAERFSVGAFRSAFRRVVDEALARHEQPVRAAAAPSPEGAAASTGAAFPVNLQPFRLAAGRPRPARAVLRRGAPHDSLG